VTITRSTLAHNTAGSLGGGGLRSDGGSLTITNSTLAHNRTDSAPGGAIFNLDTLLTLTNTTVAENFSGIFGGGGLYNPAGTVTITNSTLARNVASRGVGGGIRNHGSDLPGLPPSSGTVILQNTILALNTATGSGPDCFGPVISRENNLLGDAGGCTITLLSGDLMGDPGLAPFADAGVPGRGHFPLLPESPAIDAGHPAVCLPTDQLGRPRQGSCEIGAVEFQPTLAAFVTGFYQDALGRAPGPTEVADWMGFLQANPALVRTSVMIHAFFDGPEYGARPVTPWEHVATLYQAILGREPEAAGLDWWVGVLLDRLNTALLLFIDSPEFHGLVPDCREVSTMAALVTRLYEEALGRTPSTDEAMTWTNYLLATCDLEGVVVAFFNSAEYLNVPRTLADSAFCHGREGLRRSQRRPSGKYPMTSGPLSTKFWTSIIPRSLRGIDGWTCGGSSMASSVACAGSSALNRGEAHL